MNVCEVEDSRKKTHFLTHFLTYSFKWVWVVVVVVMMQSAHLKFDVLFSSHSCPFQKKSDKTLVSASISRFILISIIRIHFMCSLWFALLLTFCRFHESLSIPFDYLRKYVVLAGKYRSSYAYFKYFECT